MPLGKSELIVFDEDMPGFGLRLRAGGSAVWIAQYRVGAKQRRVTLGRTAMLDPDRARKAAREVLCKAGLGQDAQAEQRDRQAKAAVTFGAIVQRYLKAVEGASKARTHGERRRHLLRNWKPFHARPIDAIARRDVAARLQVLADEHGPIASNRARATLSAFYGWAIGRGHADTNPVIGTDRVGIERSRERVLVGGRYPQRLGRRRRGRSRPHPEAAAAHRPALWRGRRHDLGRARPRQGGLVDAGRVGRRTACRTTSRCRSKRWRCSARSRDATGERCCLVERADPSRAGPSPRSGSTRGSPANVPSCALADRWRRASSPHPDDALVPWTLHDLRRTVVTGMNELGIAPHVVEAVVNHVSGRAKAGVAGVYNRAVYGREKRAALQAWADHLDEVLGLGERKVIPLLV